MTSLAHHDWFKDPALQRVLSLLNGAGAETRIVGGAVRNSLMDLPVGDIDLATTLMPEEVIARADAAGIKAVPTGISHGTVTLVVDGEPFEVTTLRTDMQTDGRHAQVVFGRDWEADAHRRDFTVNALYLDQDGRVIDFVSGLADIERRNIKFIGEASRRIAEDYLRILRFFRFFAWYGTGRPDADGLRACVAARGRLSTLSAERIWSETRKLLSADDPGRALLWMRQVGVLTEVLPETEKWGIDAMPGLVAAETALGWSPDPLLRLASIVPPDAERISAMSQRLKMSKAEAGFLQDWAKTPNIDDEMSTAGFKRLLYRRGTAGILAKLKLSTAVARSKAEGDTREMARTARLIAFLDEARRWEKPQFPLSGADVIALGVPAGPEVGKMLTALEDQWVEENFAADRAALLGRLKDAPGISDR
ncbi:CCA tRNA nucleotidyltransferase [Oryzifoliimicrobium ureilyticus]|uniref:CCA tRNA nucleotidyltransferase n=1 Tax=Oryzifoliimicrobium ureilyticus TaxID=3113724 RepID=UPI003076579E